jgi:hypothetical protein
LLAIQRQNIAFGVAGRIGPKIIVSSVPLSVVMNGNGTFSPAHLLVHLGASQMGKLFGRMT